MALTIQFGDPTVTTFTLDETAGLQNTTTTPTPPGDKDDEDISRATLQSTAAAFDTLLFTTMNIDSTFAADGRIAQSTSNFLVASGATITGISLAGEFDPSTGTAAALVAYDGTNFASGGDTGLTTTAGEEIRLFSDFTSNPVAGAGLTGSVAFGVDSSGDIVFAIFMKATPVSGQTNIQFSMVTFEAIQHGDTTSADEAVNLNDFLSLTAQTQSGFNFEDVPPGKSMVLTAAALSGSGGVIVTPLTEVVEINTSNADPSGVIGFGSQGINAGETVAMTWVESGLDPNVTIPNLDQNEADLATNIKFGTLDIIDEASFTIMQKVGSATAAVKITALATHNEDGTGDGNFFDFVGNASVGGAGDDTIVNITSVTLKRGTASATLTDDGNFTGISGASADFLGNGQVTITGLLTGDVITYLASDHERLLITGVSGNVDIGGFSTIETGSTATPIGDFFQIEDDGPTIVTALPTSAVEVENTAPVNSDPIAFAFKIGSDANDYAAGSDFVDSDNGTAGVQIDLNGTVGNGPDNDITAALVTLTSEDSHNATFDFSFKYDTDPNTDGVQEAIANGDLTFDKDLGTVTFALDSPLEGFSTTVLHTNELLAKNPTGNTGHPPLVVEKLAEDFYVQFTADAVSKGHPFGFSTTGDAETTDNVFNGDAHDLVGGAETWVSATQSTNGVAGDTIQQGENLTLRFFGQDVLNQADPPGSDNGHTDPTTSVDGIAIKFDGIGSSEDLIVILDLVNPLDPADKITKAVLVENGDIFKHADGVPAPYNIEFSLDHNDGLVIIEHNDYNFGNDNYQIQGVQIMQSANGLIGTGINLNRAVGENGGSATNGTQTFTETSFHTTDVLKITDIGFVQTQFGTQDGSLDFSFQLVDGDGDTTATQHLLVDVLNA
jgi:hypothetical protein